MKEIWFCGVSENQIERFPSHNVNWLDGFRDRFSCSWSETPLEPSFMGRWLPVITRPIKLVFKNRSSETRQTPFTNEREISAFLLSLSIFLFFFFKNEVVLIPLIWRLCKSNVFAAFRCGRDATLTFLSMDERMAIASAVDAERIYSRFSRTEILSVS